MATEFLKIGECEVTLKRGGAWLKGGELTPGPDGDGEFSIYLDFEEIEDLYVAALQSRDP
jgi:hypothetical protein